MKYKIGDKVRVVGNLMNLDHEKYDIVCEMYWFADKECTIKDIDDDGDYRLEEDHQRWTWCEELLKPTGNARIDEELAKTKVKLECILQDNEAIKAELKRKEAWIKQLEAVNDNALTRLSETGREISKLQQKIARLEGKLDRARNIIRMISGRENW